MIQSSCEEGQVSEKPKPHVEEFKYCVLGSCSRVMERVLLCRVEEIIPKGESPNPAVGLRSYPHPWS